MTDGGEKTTEKDLRRLRRKAAYDALSDTEQKVIQHIAELHDRMLEDQRGVSHHHVLPAAAIELKQFIADQFGRDTEFYRELELRGKKELTALDGIRVADAVMNAVLDGRYQLRSIREKAETALTDDMLDQADRLVNTKKYHPAAGLLIAVASLEQFLRAWCERAGVAPTKQRPTIGDLNGKLRQNDLISDGEAKDVTAWASRRNDAAHGRFDEVKRDEAKLVLSGIRLFMRKHEGKSVGKAKVPV